MLPGLWHEISLSPKFALGNLEKLELQVRLTRIEQPPFQPAIFVVGIDIHRTFRYVNGAILNANQLRVGPLRALDNEPAISQVS